MRTFVLISRHEVERLCSFSGCFLSDCLYCGFEANADENAAQVIAERFGDDELNALPFRDVETALAIRFLRRLPDALRIRRARTATCALVAER
jgi:hypothetical protein